MAIHNNRQIYDHIRMYNDEWFFVLIDQEK